MLSLILIALPDNWLVWHPDNPPGSTDKVYPLR